jgi:type I restriction enzyme S subunit
MTWPMVSLGDAVSFRGGGTPRKDVPEYWSDEIPWATVKDFKSLALSKTQDSISKKGLECSASNLIPAGHVIIPTRMALGKAAINTIDLAINQDLRALIPRQPMDSAYLLHSMLGLSEIIERNGSGATVKGITQKKLAELQIPLPPLPEQKRIAGILDAADALRAKRRKSLAQLDTLLQSTFLDMFGDPVTNPMGWDETLRLGDLTEIVSGITKGRKTNGIPSREVPYLAVSNVQDRSLRLDVVKTIAATDAEIARYALKPGDLLLTEGGDPDKLGRGSLWNGEIAECIHQNHVFRIRLNSPKIHATFLNWIVGSQRGKQYFLRAAKQTTGIASINMKQLKAFPLMVPPIDLQRRFATIVESVERQKDRMRAHLAELDALFASLQSRAFAGTL